MGVRTWAYEPEKCDGDYCACDCDNCPKSRDSEHIPFHAVLKALDIKLEENEVEND